MSKTKIRVVVGSPFAGKSTYVNNHKGDNDLVFDFDSIMESLSGLQMHQKNKNLISYVVKIRNLILDSLKNETKLDTVYIIMTFLNKDLLKDLQYEVIEIKTSKEECLNRANNSNRPNKEMWIDLIHKYFDKVNESENRDMTTKRIELRSSTLELLETNDNEMILEGYVNKTNQYSQLLGGRKKFKERILPNAFRNALNKGNKVNLLLEHDPQKLLASTKNNSLELIEDEVGLKMRAKIVPTTLGKDTYEMVKAGLIDGMSFGFTVLKDKWKKLADNTYLRDVVDLNLFEVTITGNPAYLQSSISARNLDIVTDVVPENVEVAETKDTTSEVVEPTQKSKNDEGVQKVEETSETPLEPTEAVKEDIKEEVEVVEEKTDKKVEEIVVSTQINPEPTTNIQDLVASMKEELKQELLKALVPATNQDNEPKKQEVKVADETINQEQANEIAPTQEEVKDENTDMESKEQEVDEVQPKEKPDYSKYYKELLALK